MHAWRHIVGLTMVGALSLFFFGCDSGDGSDGAPGSSSGTLQGKVTNSMTGDPVAGATVTTSPDVATLTTDANGQYSAEVPIGAYMVTVSADYFVAGNTSVSVVAAKTSTVDADLDPVAPVVVEASVSGDATPGAILDATAQAIVLDGSTIQGVMWQQSNSVAVDFGTQAEFATSVMLPPATAYKEELYHILSEPPVTQEELPENVELPEGEFPAGIPNRFGVVGVNSFALEKAGEIELTATVTTTSGTYKSDLTVHTTMPFKRTSGIKNVPIGIPVLLHGRSHVDEDEDGFNDDTGLPTTYDWSLTRPAGSATTLVDGTTQDPYFTPDIVGQYTLTVTDTTQLPGTDVVTIEVEAARWQGAITGQDANGRPLADACTNCHNDVIAPDKFTSWKETGHAEIFTNLLNTNSHYSENCFGCHLVGYDPDVDNGGADDSPDWDDFIASGLLGSPDPDNWTTVLAQFPSVAMLANVQCENCHGPQIGGSHPDVGNARRTSLSADVCGYCHGEPLRHARFQQWQLSKHSNYELAQDEGESGSCSRCHTANGFLKWLPILLDDDPMTDPTANITVDWSPNDIHPQTCATCHDPHEIGTTSGDGTNAKVRIAGNTPPLIAGFQVIGAGKGAICMTCHNSRRGLRNDGNFATSDTASAARAPHGGVQTDLIMGQNAYFVEVGIRGNHSLVKDVCVNCHMRQTEPPAVLSYNQGGTNHTFFASKTICSNCHGDSFDADGVQDVFNALVAEVKVLLEEAVLAEFDTQIAAGNSIDLGGVSVTDTATIDSIEFGESRGRQAITVTFTDMSVVGPVRLTDVHVIDGAMMDIGALYDFADERLPKAGWNYNLAHSDGSHGIHNPTFSQRFLTATINELNDLLAP